MKIKKGVKLHGIKLEMQNVLRVANQVYRNHDHELVVTSALDSTHSASSYHYFGYAIDFRTRFFKSDAESLDVAQEIRQKLSKEYLVLFEKNHIHVQFNARI